MNFRNVNKIKLIKRFCFLIGIVILFRMLVVDLYYTPTSSMSPEIQAHSFLIVDKIKYGTKLPETIYGVPVLSKLFKGINWEIPLWKDTNLPQIRPVEHHDIVLAKGVTQKMKIIKRVIGIPGDTILIKNGDVSINGKIDGDLNLVRSYLVESDNIALLKSLRKSSDSRWSSSGRSRSYLVTATTTFFNQIRPLTEVTVKADSGTSDSMMDKKIFPSTKLGEWTRENYGPLVVPYKGMIIDLNDSDVLALYCDTLEGFENCVIDQVGNRTRVNGTIQDTYIFKNDYYFLLGDNRVNSEDSRAWGVIPRSYIIGQVVSWFKQ